ncbi:Microtubule-actin cross-linking factor 1, isoforms 1/2/3/5 [Oryzias melastigma]|uniref:Microtubule-actin cross-linking factor 1, isoforms 1/2/3/5 n=1 Tax=Oryzias melastigma TaxID=30732 RepID=A0A834L3H9_ORYME|nr:Microtubule-actin cross-linking factor 1, isoforms 1/2/3/5 [Oryzias melastigma]
MATKKDRRKERAPRKESLEEELSAPCPGDTLPWNLSKYQRVKRSKSASAEVLDPAERAVIRIAEDLAQRKF